MNTEASRFYLFASPAGTPTESRETVFYEVVGEPSAKSLCALFTKEYGNKSGSPLFHYKAAASMPPEEQILLDEALRDVDVYDEPDRFVYDPPPPKELHLRAQYAVRAKGWEDLIQERAAPPSGNAVQSKPGVHVMSDDKRQLLKTIAGRLTTRPRHHSWLSQEAARGR